MKNLLSILMVLALVGMAVPSFAAIDWAGNAYPNNGHNTTPTGDQFVVAQVYKGGVTDGAGQGADLSATLYWQTDAMGAQSSVAMAYNTDVGNNDEYIGYIPQADLVGAAWVDVTVIFHDTSDDPVTDFEITGDQQGNPPLLRYNVVDVLPNDVTVTFTLCMSGTETIGAPCVIGGADPIGNWGTGVNMTNVSGELWTVDVVWPAGSSPSFEYKYKKDDCVNWESVGNRVVALPTDGTTNVVLATDSWDNQPIGCGLGSVLEEDKEVCFQVCMDGVDNIGGVCTVGNGLLLDDWGTGIAMSELGGGLWQVCVTYVQGTPIPFNQEFKFKKDDCNTWESVGNRLVVIDNSSPTEQTLTYSWDDGPGFCTPIGTETGSWGSLKANY